MMRQRVFGITGWKNSGKTTLTERLVAAFAARGLKVATVKHAHHSFDVDRPGTDSHRHRTAGATETAIVSGRRWALMHELHDEAEPSLDAVVARLSPADIVLVEGYKNAPHEKIECRRVEGRDTSPLAGAVPNVVAVASDGTTQTGDLPHFSLDEVEPIADFILERMGVSGGQKG